AELPAANKSTPVFAAHGTNDGVVPCQRGELAAKNLQAKGMQVTWKTYPMEHSVCGEELQDIASFLKLCFGQ
ncbi:MAG: prolyl oligopeptidase family serine peptidase, partial [Limnobacter sp.]|nr:prolyl oligopeptidase family serine peptidase [Limnobacter sp.]